MVHVSCNRWYNAFLLLLEVFEITMYKIAAGSQIGLLLNVINCHVVGINIYYFFTIHAFLYFDSHYLHSMLF